jgi:hypothetical protein
VGSGQPLEKLDGTFQAAWREVGRTALASVRQFEGKSIRQAAAHLFGLFVATAGLPVEEFHFEALPEVEQIAWEAIVRHAATLADYDPEEYGPLEQLESSWAAWAREKMAMAKGG